MFVIGQMYSSGIVHEVNRVMYATKGIRTYVKKILRVHFFSFLFKMPLGDSDNYLEDFALKVERLFYLLVSYVNSYRILPPPPLPSHSAVLLLHNIMPTH